MKPHSFESTPKFLLALTILLGASTSYGYRRLDSNVVQNIFSIDMYFSSPETSCEPYLNDNVRIHADDNRMRKRFADLMGAVRRVAYSNANNSQVSMNGRGSLGSSYEIADAKEAYDICLGYTTYYEEFLYNKCNKINPKKTSRLRKNADNIRNDCISYGKQLGLESMSSVDVSKFGEKVRYKNTDEKNQNHYGTANLEYYHKSEEIRRQRGVPEDFRVQKEHLYDHTKTPSQETPELKDAYVPKGGSIFGKIFGSADEAAGSKKPTFSSARRK